MQEKSDLTADDVLVQQAKQAFEESVERIDGQTLSKLNRARQTALSELTPRKSAISRWTPLAGFAAATAAAIVFLNNSLSVSVLGFCNLSTSYSDKTFLYPSSLKEVLLVAIISYGFKRIYFIGT